MLHYFLPDDAFDSALPGGSVCDIEQFADHPDCASLFPNTVANSQAAFNAVLQQRQMDPDLTFPETGIQGARQARRRFPAGVR